MNNAAASQIDLTVVVTPLTWTGAANNGTWDTGSTNWSIGSPPSAAATQYSDGFAAVFGDTNPITGNPVPANGNGTAVITVQGPGMNNGVSPYSITFTNTGAANGGVDYSIGGGSINGSTGITLAGTGGVGGTVYLTGVNAFSGPVAINAGQLVVQNNQALGNSAGVAVASGASLTLSGGVAVGSIPLGISGSGLSASVAGALNSSGGSNSYAGAITLAGNATIKSAGSGNVLTLTGGINNGGNLLTFTGDGNTTVSSNPITGAGGLTVGGSGTVNLTTTNSYGGATNVNSGTLRVSNNSGSATAGGTVAVAADAVLSGSGMISGLVSVAAGGHLAPSNMAGTTTQLNLNGGLSLADGATTGSGTMLDFNLTAPNSGDLVFVNGNLAIGANGVLNINPNGGSELSTGDYPLIDYTGNLAADNSGSWNVGSHATDLGHSYSFMISMGTGPNSANQFDLVVSPASSQAIWSSNSMAASAPYNSGLNWSTGSYPSGQGQTAVFGSGTESTVSLGGMTYTLGSLVFDNTGNPAPSTAYLLENGKFMIDNGANPASISMSSNLSAEIDASLQLSSASKQTTFTINSGASLDVVGTVGELTNTPQQITLAGGGTLEFDNNNSYSGGTTINNGTLLAGSNANTQYLTFGSGPITFNPGGGNTAILAVNNPLVVNNISETAGAAGSAQINIASYASLTVNQTTPGSFAGTVAVSSYGSLTMQGSSTLAISGKPTFYANSSLTVSSGTLSITAAPTFGGGNSIAVNGGTLSLANNTAATVSGAVTVSVQAGGTLQLAGAASALANFDGSNAANITTLGSGNNGDGALMLTGQTTQTVGVISGQTLSSVAGATTYSGNTTVGDGTNAASLTATQILQNSLTINANSTVTILPSGSGGDVQADAAASGAALATENSAPASSDSDGNGSAGGDPFTAIQAAIASGAVSSTTGQVLENRIAAIERLAVVDPGLNVDLLESRVLAALPTGVEVPISLSPASDSGSNLLALGSSTFASASDSIGAAATFSFEPGTSGSAAVPEPSALILAITGGMGLAVVLRQARKRRCDRASISIA